MTFVDIAQHPLLSSHRYDFRENIDFYTNIQESDEIKIKDNDTNGDYGEIDEM